MMIKKRADKSDIIRLESYRQRCSETADSSQMDHYETSVWESVFQRCESSAGREGLREVITPRQMKFAMLRADGCSDSEIARRYGLTPSYVAREINAAGNAIVGLAPELLNLIAA